MILTFFPHFLFGAFYFTWIFFKEDSNVIIHAAKTHKLAVALQQLMFSICMMCPHLHLHSSVATCMTEAMTLVYTSKLLSLNPGKLTFEKTHTQDWAEHKPLRSAVGNSTMYGQPDPIPQK